MRLWGVVRAEELTAGAREHSVSSCRTCEVRVAAHAPCVMSCVMLRGACAMRHLAARPAREAGDDDVDLRPRKRVLLQTVRVHHAAKAHLGALKLLQTHRPSRPVRRLADRYTDRQTGRQRWRASRQTDRQTNTYIAAPITHARLTFEALKAEPSHLNIHRQPQCPRSRLQRPTLHRQTDRQTNRVLS
jgi:hypothetical protein